MGSPEAGKCVAVVATDSDVSIAACEERTNLGLGNYFPGKKHYESVVKTKKQRKEKKYIVGYL